MDLYIMRHGETYWNKEGRIQGASDIELTPLGVELAEISADGFLRDGIFFDRIYTSPLVRAVTTARILAQNSLRSVCDAPVSSKTNRQPFPSEYPNLFVEDRLREMCFGKYEGQYLKECRVYDKNIELCFSKPSLYVPDPTGESYEALFSRIDEFTDQELLPLEHDSAVRNVLVICHGTVIRAFLRRIRGLSLDDFWHVRQPNCSINHFTLTGGVFHVVEENILYYDSEEVKNRFIL